MKKQEHWLINRHTAIVDLVRTHPDASVVHDITYAMGEKYFISYQIHQYPSDEQAIKEGRKPIFIFTKNSFIAPHASQVYKTLGSAMSRIDKELERADEETENYRTLETIARVARR